MHHKAPRFYALPPTWKTHAAALRVPPHQIMVNLDHLQENVVLPSRNPILPHLRLLSCCSRTWGSRELDFFALDGLVMLLGDAWRLGGWLLNCELCWNWKMNDAHGSRSTMLIPCISLHLSLCSVLSCNYLDKHGAAHCLAEIKQKCVGCIES